MAALNDWDTDPYGDPTQPSNPWSGSDTTVAPFPDIPSGDAATGSGLTPTQTSAPAGGSDPYDAHLANIAQASTPTTQATAQDGLARQLQNDLEADGHEVTWNDATRLSIDGRDYELGGGQGVTDPTARSGAPGSDLPLWQQPWLPGADRPQGNPPGQHWDPTMANFVPDAPAPDTGPGGGAGAGGRMDDSAIMAQIAQWAQMPGADPSLASNPAYWLAAIKSRGGLGSDNLQYWQDASVGPTAFFNNPNREAARGGGGGTTGGAGGGAGLTSPWMRGGSVTDTPWPEWSPSAPSYAPNFIDTSASELPGYDDIMAALSAPNAGDEDLQKLVQSIVAHPETLTTEDIDRLKAQSAEEAAIAAQSNDEELQHYGFSTGLDSSPWLAGQRAQNAWSRSNSTITANRGIDIAAADRRQADRQSAAAIGQGFSSFQSSKKAQSVGLAVQAALGKAGEQRSRAQLNESLKQAATQLGLTKDNLVMTYLSHAMTDLTNNKQIDLGFDIDMKKLAEQSDEFKTTLLQRIHEMQQADDQFGANYGLALQEFQHKKDQDAWERAKSTVGT